MDHFFNKLSSQAQLPVLLFDVSHARYSERKRTDNPPSTASFLAPPGYAFVCSTSDTLAIPWQYRFWAIPPPHPVPPRRGPDSKFALAELLAHIIPRDPSHSFGVVVLYPSDPAPKPAWSVSKCCGVCYRFDSDTGFEPPRRPSSHRSCWSHESLGQQALCTIRTAGREGRLIHRCRCTFTTD